MNVWCLTYLENEVSENVREWFAREPDADDRRAEVAADPERYQLVRFERVSIPTTRAPLVHWLNVHARVTD